MRDIIFRGKSDRGPWVYGSLIKTGTFCCVLEEDDGTNYDYPYLDGDLGCIDGYATPIEPKTIGQYTGFADLNGRRIFEGDIVERAYHRTYMSNLMYVVEHRGSWELWDHNENEDFLCNWCSSHYLNGQEIGGCYVRGNIYDTLVYWRNLNHANHL